MRLVLLGSYDTEPASSSVTGAPTKPTFTPLSGTRILDTRTSSGGPGAGQHLGAGATATFTAAGLGGVPANATAIEVNINHISSTVNGSTVTAFAAGATRPSGIASSYAGLGSITTATIPVNATGQYSLYNSAGTTDIIFYVVGYYTAPQVISTYNGDGQRATMTTPGNASGNRTFSYDNNAASWGDGVPRLLTDGVANYVYGPGGQLLEVVATDGATGARIARWATSDDQGNTRVIASDAGAVTGTLAYDAYGNTTAQTGTAVPLQYGGGYRDPNGLIYLQNRYFDPTVGQFITLDPIVGETAAPYTYASANPVAFEDPLGLQTRAVLNDLAKWIGGPQARAMNEVGPSTDPCANPVVVAATAALPFKAGKFTRASAEGLDDGVVLVRGGTNTADRFTNGSGVTSDAAGNLFHVSVNSGRTVEEAAQGIKNNQIGVSTVGDVRNAGGTVTRDPTPHNPHHCLISGCTADVLSDLFTPTLKNPGK